MQPASSTTRSIQLSAARLLRGRPVQHLATMALLMVAVLAVGLAGCGSSQSTSGTNAARRTPSAIPSPTPSPSPNPAALIPGWKLIWWDEFDGPSLDATKWNVVSDAPGGYQHCCMSGNLAAWAPDDVSLVGGSLRLTTERRSFQGHAYTSGAVSTKGKFNFLYGRLDIRARLPRGNGLWPAFWLLPDVPGSANLPYEVDVAEALGQWPHTDFMVAWDGSQRTGYCEYNGPDFSADYHVFSFIWTASSISWQIDGTQRCSFTTGVPSTRMELILNTFIGGSWPVPPDASTVLPQYTDIDYVRVYTPASA